ncbi:MAG: endonuclease/exonuclease/phosphatase family protein [Bacteroidota bacterium]
MKKTWLLFLCLSFILPLPAQTVKLLTWNIQDLGRSKDEAEIKEMVKIMRQYDLIAIQEVVAKDPAGARKVAELADLLNRSGNRWDYRISNPTQSPSAYISERYAFIWKSSLIQNLGSPYLDQDLARACFREPYIGKFRLKSHPEPFYVVNFHARKHDQQPEEEIQFFSQYQRRLGSDYVFIAGDFNLDDEHEVWNALKWMGFRPAISQVPTTLKRKCTRQAEYFNYPIDNIFFDRDVCQRLDAGRVDFVRSCERLELARGISDHLPVFLAVQLTTP